MSEQAVFPLVSIVTPSFNQAEFLERTIQSVLSQDYPNLEYIIIDGGSTDGSVEIIRKYENRLAYWVSEKDKGQTNAINKGFNRAKGEIFAWLNSDDIYEPGAIHAAVEALTSDPSLGFVYGDCNFIDSHDRIIGKFDARQTDLKKLQRGYVHIPQQAFFFRGALWKKVGPLDESIYFAMDYDLWLRLARIAPFRYIPGKVWADFRLHEDAKTITADASCWPEMIQIRRRDGRSKFSVLFLKYQLRKLIAPLINHRRKKMFQ